MNRPLTMVFGELRMLQQINRLFSLFKYLYWSHYLKAQSSIVFKIKQTAAALGMKLQ